jgi:nicotinamidase-related amidase
MKKIAVLVIDGQNDFCNPTGALFVPGADEDMKRLAKFIERNKSKIGYIGLTQDSHMVIDISHPPFWQDKEGNFPNPFTIISAKDVKAGTWTPRFYPQAALKYLEDLETQGEFPHCIWPIHCVDGSEGAAIFAPLMKAVQEWSTSQCLFHKIVKKGVHPLTEHFGVFQANIPIPGEDGTQFNDRLAKILNEYDEVYFAGEAKTHCTATSLKQAMKFDKNLAKKFVILEDCMSPVPGEVAPGVTFEKLAQPIYDDAKALGIKFVKSTDVTL